MRIFLFLVLATVTSAFSFQFYRLAQQKKGLDLELAKINQQIIPIKEDNEKLLADVKYFEKPERLENELRKAGYALPEEKMLIIVPEK